MLQAAQGVVERLSGGGMGERQSRGAVAEHERQALCGISRIQGHVGAARLQDGQQADHHLQRALDADGDAFVGPEALGLQATCELVGAGVQLA